MMFQWYKAMERAVITMNEHGAVFVPDGEIWMSEMELDGLVWGNRPDSPCSHPSRLQKLCTERIRSTEVYPVGERILCRCV